MKKYLVILFLTLCHWSSAQNFTLEKAREDLLFLKESIETYNPGLELYHPDFSDQATDLIDQLPSEGLSRFEYRTRVAQLCALSHEGHFSVGNWRDTVHQGILSSEIPYLPIEVKLSGEKIFIKYDYSRERQMEAGDEILSINGQPSSQVLDFLISAQPSDGFIRTYALEKIEGSFGPYYLLAYGPQDSVEIEYLNASQERKVMKMKTLIRSEQVDNFKKYKLGTIGSDAKAADGFYQLSYQGNTAILSLPSFDFRRVNKYDVKADKMYRKLFQELANNGVENLIIDLRDNTGGRNEFADEMVPFIMKKEATEKYLKITRSWEGKEREYRMPKISRYAFTGRILVLVNGETFSSGSSLSRYLKEYGEATFIGTETGTRYEGFVAGSQEVVSLPNSGMEIGIPRWVILYPKSEKQTTVNRGLIPDYIIPFSMGDYLQGNDLHLQKAFELIGPMEMPRR